VLRVSRVGEVESRGGALVVPRGTSPASVPGVEFSRELRDDVLAGDITLSVRLWKRPQVKQGGRYRVGPGLIEVDAIELVPFAAISEDRIEADAVVRSRPGRVPELL
jgi:hypothetical protein